MTVLLVPSQGYELEYLRDGNGKVGTHIVAKGMGMKYLVCLIESLVPLPLQFTQFSYLCVR